MMMLVKVALIPFILVLKIMGVAVNLIIKVECWAAGIIFLFAAISILLAVVNQLWLQAGIIGGMFGVCVMILFLTAEIKIFIDGLIDKMTI